MFMPYFRSELLLPVLPLLLFSGLAMSLESELTDAARWPLASTRSLRLPNDTYPLIYQVHIATNIHLGDFKFTGNVSIDIEIRRSTNEIVLHAKNLSDIELTLRLLDSVRPEHPGHLVDDIVHSYDPHSTFLIIHPRINYQAFEAGQRYRLQISYTGLMNTRAKGIHWMAYDEPQHNRTVYVAATQAEPTYARLFLPCYDEPAFKSNFSIRLTHGGTLTAISNMPVAEVISQGELTTTTFQTTPPMSTYLVAFVISDFDHISETYRGVSQSIYSSPNIASKGRTTLKDMVRALAAFEDVLDVSYSLPKLDYVAVKRSQGAAMENWGLITFKDDGLVPQGEPHRKDNSLKNRIIQLHEMAHQWFGNLVSPEWWTYVWLNEGFATYFSYVIADMLYPEMNAMYFFNRDEAHHAFSYNRFNAGRPTTHYVESEQDIMALFDVITYKRSACIIKMFHHAFHQETFVTATSRYLKKFQYSVANELDLFEVLQEAILEDDRFEGQTWKGMIRDIMLTWMHSEWLPIVSVIRNYENNTITLRQLSLHPKAEYWWIPLNFASSQSPHFETTHVEYFMPPVREHTLSLDELQLKLGGRDWLIINKQQTGFYYVHYDTENLHAIARQLKLNHSVIHPLNRASLFHDLDPLIERNEFEPMEVVFEIFKYLEFEENPRVWSVVSYIIQFFQNNLYGTPTYSLFNQFLRRLVTPSFLRVFNEHVTDDIVMFTDSRSEILSMACRADLPECLDYAKRMTYDYIFKNIDVDKEFPDSHIIHDGLTCMGLRYQTDEQFDKLMGLLNVTECNSMLFDDMIYSMRCMQNHRHMYRYLTVLAGKNFTYSLLSEKEFMLYLAFIYKSSLATRSPIWHFIEHNYKHLARSDHFAQLFNDIAEFVPDRQRAYFAMLHQNIMAHLQEKKLTPKGTLLAVDSHRVGKKMRNNEQFLDKFQQRIHSWLLDELRPGDKEATYAASFGARNGSNRPTSLLSAATDIIRSALGA